MNYVLGAIVSLGILFSPAFAGQALAAGLSSSQIDATLEFLHAFHADQSVIDNVRISLRGGTPILGGQSVTNTNPTAPSCIPPKMWNGSICVIQTTTAIAATPTASITVNGGQKKITVAIGDTITKTWSSTGGSSWNATWAAKAIRGSDCFYNARIGQHWNGLDGGVDTTGDKENGTETAPATADQVGCIFTITYVATNALASKSAVSSIEITFPANPKLSPSGNACVAPTTTTSSSPLKGVVYGPGATSGIIIEGISHSAINGMGAIDGTHSSVQAITDKVRSNVVTILNSAIALRNSQPWYANDQEPFVTDSYVKCIKINGDVVYGSSANNNFCYSLISPNYKSATFTPIISAPLLGSPLDSAGSNKLVVMPMTQPGANAQLYAPYGLARSFQFTTGDAGEQARFLTEESDLGSRHALFMTISTVPNDFRYDSLDTPLVPATSSHGAIDNGCADYAVSGIGVIRYRVANPTDPVASDSCRLKPHTTYYVNIRNELPGSPFDPNLSVGTSLRGKDTAYPTGGNALLFQANAPSQGNPVSDVTGNMTDRTDIAKYQRRQTKYPAAILNPTSLSFGNEFGDWIYDPKNEIPKKYAGPDLGSTTTTTGGGVCTPATTATATATTTTTPTTTTTTVLPPIVSGALGAAGQYYYPLNPHVATPYTELSNGPKSFAPTMNCEIMDLSTLDMIKRDTVNGTQNKAGLPEAQWQTVKAQLFKEWDDLVAAGRPATAIYSGHNLRWKVPPHGCIALKFKTGSRAGMFFAMTEIDPIAAHVGYFINLSRNPGDFDYTNIMTAPAKMGLGNAGIGAVTRINFYIKDRSAGTGLLNAGGLEQQLPVLQPNTTYYLNYRNEYVDTSGKDPEAPALKGVDLCYNAQIKPGAAPELTKGCGGLFQVQYRELDPAKGWW